MSTGQQYSTDMIIQALEDKHGAVYLAADSIGCSYKTILRRAKDVQSVADVLLKYRGRRCDIAELALDRALANGEAWAIRFALETLGKDRGYVARTESKIEGSLLLKFDLPK